MLRKCNSLDATVVAQRRFANGYGTGEEEGVPEQRRRMRSIYGKRVHMDGRWRRWHGRWPREI